jgi:uncharacterized protein YaaQ
MPSHMKFLISIVQAYDCDKLLRAIVEGGLHATKIASVGGFLRTGNATVFMGLHDDQIDRALAIIRETCRSRVEVKIEPEFSEYMDWYPAGVHDVTVGGAVVFVVPVSRAVRLTAEGMVNL